jgi:carboxylesterase
MGTCLLIHGFTGTPFEIEPLARLLHEQGYEIVTPTLAGHGGDRQQMMHVTWRDWIVSVEVELRELFKREGTVHLVGFSMGGLIAAYLAAKHPGRITSLTMLSAPIYTVNSKQLFKTIAEAIQKSMRTGARQEDVTRYLMKVRATPLRSLAHFRRLVQTVKGQLGDVDVPLLVIQGEQDDLVEARSAAYIYESVKTTEKQLHLFAKSRHMICHDCEAEEVIRLVASFIREREKGNDGGS